MSIRVAVLNDHELVVMGIKALLGPYTHRVCVVDSRAARRAQVDVVLYDPLHPSPGPALDPRASTHRGRLVALGWYVDPTQVHAIIRAGADGYIFKGLEAHELVDALERAHRGELVTAAGPGDPTQTPPPLGRWPGDRAGLSPRESEIVAMICQGLSNHDIADRLFISVNTVKSGIRSAYRKIGVKTRPQAVIWGLTNEFGTALGPTPPPDVAMAPVTVA